MNQSELIRLATQPGPMQQMALQALAEQFAADDRADYGPAGKSAPFDPEAYLQAAFEARMAQPKDPVPHGDYGPGEEEALGAEQDYQDLYEDLYGPGWQDYVGMAGDYAGSQEGIRQVSDLARDTFVPGYTQLDSLGWMDDNLKKYHELRETSPFMAMGYLPLAALGAIGSIPGAAPLIGGGRKLGALGKAAYEGLFKKGGRV